MSIIAAAELSPDAYNQEMHAAHLISAVSTQPSTSSAPPYRLLYRGALSLPDSYILLDGLTFCAWGSVLENPLALALESMRGRQSLRFKGTVSLKDTHIDSTGNVCMDIHPDATLSRIYFDNVFCLSPLDVVECRSEIGVQVALGDTDGPETTNMIIYAKLSSPTSNALQLFVARMKLTPPQASHTRLPRPDDPTPRQPPLAFSKAKGKGRALKPEDDRVKAAREVMLFGRAARSAEKGKGKAIFKVPTVPQGQSTTKTKHQGRKISERVSTADETDKKDGNIEDTNKQIIKKLSVRCMAASGVDRSHPEFQEIFGFIYRGTAFALRTQMVTRKLDSKNTEMEDIIQRHIELYVPSSNRGR